MMTWQKAIKTMKSTKRPLSKETIARCIKPCDHAAFLMLILKYHCEKWITDIKKGEPRKKGMSVGANKLASDKKGYTTFGNMSQEWMNSEHWVAWMKLGMLEYEPGLNMEADVVSDDMIFNGYSSNDDSDEVEVPVWDAHWSTNTVAATTTPPSNNQA